VAHEARSDKPDNRGLIYRAIPVAAADIDSKAREVKISFSSEEPVMRYDWRNEMTYLEVLDHAPENADISRLNNKGAFLVNHNTDDQVGAFVRGSVRIDPDRVGRGTVKLSRSARGEEILADMVDDIRGLVSFGYQTTKLLSKETKDGQEIRRYAFRAYEASSVPIPADETVGVGRSEPTPTPIPLTQKKMNTDTVPAPAAPPLPTPGLELGRESSRKSEIDAIATHIGDRIPGIAQMAKDAVALGRSVEQFRADVFAKLPNSQPAQPLAPLDVKPKDLARYSLARAISAKVSGKFDGFEAEMNQEIALKHGRAADGFWVPDEIMARNAIAGTPTLGGMLVQVDNKGDLFIEMLRNKSQVISLGARTLNLSRGCTIPRQNGAHVANWVTETTASTLSGANFQHLTLTPKAITSNVQYSKLLLMESDPSVDGILRDDITAQLGLAIDLAALHGTGSAQPVGIIGTSGIGSVLLSTNGLAINNATAYPLMVSLESLVAAANADSGSLAYLMRPTIRGALKSTQKFGANTSVAVWEDGMVNGYRAEVSNQVSAALTEGTATTITTPVFFGNWNELIVASFGSTDLVVDEYTLAANRVVKILAHRYVDIGVRHGASFAVAGGILGG